MSNANPDFSSRSADPGVDKLFVTRWSPRAFLPDAIDARQLATIFDAARWAPSCFNEQPWLFYTSTASSYDRFLGLLVEANQQWAKTAPVIGFAVAAKTFARNGKPNNHAEFDAGAAWMSLNLQAALVGVHMHGMAGIDFAGVYSELGIDPQTHQVICGFVMGKVDPDAQETLTVRKPLQDSWVAVA